MHHYTIQTSRLILRPLSVSDAEAAFVWLTDPDVNRYMTYPLYRSVEEVKQWLRSVRWDDQQLLWGFVRREDGLLIGSGGLRLTPESAWNLGYNLRRDCWHQGYATEAAQAILTFIRSTLDLKPIVAQHAAANPASGAVLRKCGMVLDHDGTYSKKDTGEVFPAYFYRLP